MFYIIRYRIHELNNKIRHQRADYQTISPLVWNNRFISLLLLNILVHYGLHTYSTFNDKNEVSVDGEATRRRRRCCQINLDLLLRAFNGQSIAMVFDMTTSRLPTHPVSTPTSRQRQSLPQRHSQ